MISFVIPLYNESESLAQLHAELVAVVQDHDLGDVEFLFVDDGSTDGSWAVLMDLATSDPRVRAVRFRRNFGKAAALAVGFAQARGRIVFTLDADGQDNPAEVPRFLSKLEEGFDLVSGWKQVRHDPWHKVLPSRVFNAVVSRVSGCRLHDHNCGFKAYRAEILGEIALYGERHRFVPVLAHARGFRVGEIVVHHRARRFGRSKYGVGRFIKGFLDLISVGFQTRYGTRPMHAFGSIGLVAILLGGLALAMLLALELSSVAVPGLVISAMVASTLVGVGLLSLGLGVLAELIVAGSVSGPVSAIADPPVERIGEVVDVDASPDLEPSTASGSGHPS